MSVVSFAALPDPRIAHKRRHDLLDIVVIALLCRAFFSAASMTGTTTVS